MIRCNGLDGEYLSRPAPHAQDRPVLIIAATTATVQGRPTPDRNRNERRGDVHGRSKPYAEERRGRVDVGLEVPAAEARGPLGGEWE